jgi:tRNA-modifying protein YgfZ
MFLDLNRKVFYISGADRFRFLNGLITQDISLLEKGQMPAIYTALLTPNGRYQFDFFVVVMGESLAVIAHDSEGLLKRIQPYKLRLDVQFQTASDTTRVYGSFELPKGGASVSFKDPRCDDLGYWLISEESLPLTEDYAQYRHRCMGLGIPDSQDFEKDRSIILEWGFEELHGISFSKGCYMGQELMSRTKHVGQIRKRVLPLQFDEVHGPIQVGDAVLYQGQEVGEIKAVHGYLALAMLRLDMIPIKENEVVSVNVNHDKAIVFKPDWVCL